MRHELKQRPDFGMVRIEFDRAGEQLLVESSAMVARDTAIEMKTAIQGGIFGAAKRKLLGGESLFQNTFTASRAGESIWLAPAPEGDVDVVECDGKQTIFLSSGAFLASAPTVKLDTKWSGAKGFFSGGGLFLLKAEGVGPLFFGAYGGIHPVKVGAAGYVCDTNHIVGFTGGLDFKIRKVGGLKSLFLSGEGLVCEFHGEGTLWISTRNPGSLASFLQPFRRVKSKNNN